MKKEEIVAQISADMKIFLNEHPQMEFYALAFDCNTEYAEFLVCMNTEDDFEQTLRDYQEDDKRYCTDAASIRDLRYNPGDWKHTDISEIEDEDGRRVITHTEVDPAYGGQGIARRLIEEVIAAARRDGAKIVPLCSYADKMMRRTDKYADVLTD